MTDGYVWKVNECNAQGVPFVKLANVVLERNGETKHFATQAEVDEAWANGYHDIGKPETAEDPVDIDGDHDDEPAAEFDEMTKAMMVEHAAEAHGLELDPRVTKNELIDAIAAHIEGLNDQG